jgi:Tfp pilus assembly protein PilF
MKLRLSFLLLFFLSGLLVRAQESLKQGLLYLNDIQYHKARSFFLDKIKTSPSDMRSYCYLGDAYIGLHLPDSAKLMYQKAFSLDPKSPFPMIGLGKIALLNGKT